MSRILCRQSIKPVPIRGTVQRNLRQVIARLADAIHSLVVMSVTCLGTDFTQVPIPISRRYVSIIISTCVRKQTPSQQACKNVKTTAKMHDVYEALVNRILGHMSSLTT